MATTIQNTTERVATDSTAAEQALAGVRGIGASLLQIDKFFNSEVGTMGGVDSGRLFNPASAEKKQVVANAIANYEGLVNQISASVKRIVDLGGEAAQVTRDQAAPN